MPGRPSAPTSDDDPESPRTKKKATAKLLQVDEHGREWDAVKDFDRPTNPFSKSRPLSEWELEWRNPGLMGDEWELVEARIELDRVD